MRSPMACQTASYFRGDLLPGRVQRKIEAVAAERGAHHLHRLTEPAAHGEQVDLEGRDRRLVLGPSRATVQLAQLPLGDLGVAGEERRPRRLEMQRERELVVRLPPVGGQALDAGGQVDPGRRVGGRRRRLARGPQGELDERDPLGGHDQRTPLHQLVDDLEDPFPQLFRLRPGQQEAPDPEVEGGSLGHFDQRVRGLLNAIVGEPVGPPAQGHDEESLLDGREEIAREGRFGRQGDRRQRLHVDGVPHAGRQLQHPTGGLGEVSDPPHDERGHVVRVARVADPRQVPAPAPRPGVEGEQPAPDQLLEELNHEERVPGGLVVDEAGKRSHLLGGAADGVGGEGHQVLRRRSSPAPSPSRGPPPHESARWRPVTGARRRPRCRDRRRTPAGGGCPAW